MKKIVSFMFWVIIPIISFAWETERFTIGDVIYSRIKDNSIDYVSVKGATAENIVVPEQVVYEGKSYEVRYVDDYAFYTYENPSTVNIRSIILPQSIQSIGTYAFCGTLLENIELPDRVTGIGRNAFSSCRMLKSIRFPEILKYIGESAFAGCSSLREITIPKNLTNLLYRTFAFCTTLETVSFPATGLEIIEQEAFLGCTSLSTIKVPEGVIGIGKGTFKGCVSMSSVVLPESLHYINDQGFEGCTALSEINFPDRIAKIGDEAFKDCSSLTSVSLPARLTTLQYATFYGCTSLESVMLPSTLQAILANVFTNCKLLKNIKIPDSVQKIWGAFAGCESLPVEDGIRYADCCAVQVEEVKAHMTVREGTRYVLPYVFAECTNVESVSLPESLKYIGDRAFRGMNLTEITIPNVTYISDYAFAGCKRLSKISLPESCEYIGPGAFSGCSALTEIDIPDNVMTIGNWAFDDCENLSVVNLPKGLKELDCSAFSGCNAFTSYICLPQGMTSFSGRFYQSFNTVRCLAPLPPTSSSSTSFLFSETTTNHAILYVPVDSKQQYAYDKGWGKFLNIKEEVSSLEEIDDETVYMLKNWTSGTFLVYDIVNEKVREQKMDNDPLETNLYSSWMLLQRNGTLYLYNIGVKKFVIANEAGFFITDEVNGIAASNIRNGISLGSSTGTWSLLKNNTLLADERVKDKLTSIKAILGQHEIGLFDLQGRMLQKKPKYGLYIQGDKKMFVK